MPAVLQSVQNNSSFSYFQNIGDVHVEFLQSQELYGDDSSCEELEEDDFDAGNFDFYDDSSFGEFLWPPEMLHNMEHLRACVSEAFL